MEEEKKKKKKYINIFPIVIPGGGRIPLDTNRVTGNGDALCSILSQQAQLSTNLPPPPVSLEGEREGPLSTHTHRHCLWPPFQFKLFTAAASNPKAAEEGEERRTTNRRNRLANCWRQGKQKKEKTAISSLLTPNRELIESCRQSADLQS